MQIKGQLSSWRGICACALGMGLFLAWTVGNSYTLSFAGIGTISLAHVLDIVFGICSNIIVLAVVLLFSKRIASLVDRRAMCTLVLVLSVVGPGLIVLSRFLGSAPVVLAIGSTMKGACAALLFLMWNEVFCRQSLRAVTICYGGAYLVSVLFQILMEWLTAPPAFFLVLACGASSSLMLAPTAWKIGGADRSEPLSPSWSFPWQLVVLCVVYSFVAFMFRQLIAGSARGLMCLGGGIVGLACVMSGVFFVARRFDISFFERLAMSLIVCGILLWCWFGPDMSTLVVMLTDAGNTSFRIFILVLLCTICYRYGAPCLWLFAIIRIAMMAAEGCGLGVSMLLTAQEGGFDSQWLLHFCYVLVMALVVFAGILHRPTRMGDELWDVLPKAKGGTSEQGERLRAVMGSSGLLLWRCGNVARQYGLTHREEEMLVCLAEGKSRSQMAAELVLSESTVSTHMRNLYRKLDVHSKSEALDIVKEAC